MVQAIDPAFGEKFLASASNFYTYGIDKLFNDWWEHAPADAVAKYVEAIESHPEQGPLAAARWYAEPLSLKALEGHAPGTLGHAYLAFMADNNLIERLALGYREFHEELAASGKLDNLPPVLEYKVLRGFQTHDLHHVLTGCPPTPFGELKIQAFGLAQMDFPYAAMWIAVVTAHMTLVDPYLIKPAMDAITEGWSLGRRARSIQFVAFENMLDRPLDEVRREYGLTEGVESCTATPYERTPELLAAA